MTSVELDVVVPVAITQRTGGYIYDARMVDGLRGLGWTVRVHELAGRFPDGGEGGATPVAAPQGFASRFSVYDVSSVVEFDDD